MANVPGLMAELVVCNWQATIIVADVVDAADCVCARGTYPDG
jgi:hypothetical protein